MQRPTKPGHKRQGILTREPVYPFRVPPVAEQPLGGKIKPYFYFLSRLFSPFNMAKVIFGPQELQLVDRYGGGTPNQRQLRLVGATLEDASPSGLIPNELTVSILGNGAFLTGQMMNLPLVDVQGNQQSGA